MYFVTPSQDASASDTNDFDDEPLSTFTDAISKAGARSREPFPITAINRFINLLSKLTSSKFGRYRPRDGASRPLRLSPRVRVVGGSPRGAIPITQPSPDKDAVQLL